jgi:predicted metal-dependent hydrolase
MKINAPDIGKKNNTPVRIKIDSIGSVLFEKSKRAKRLNITIRPFKGVRVAIPRSISYSEAERFAHTKVDWIKKHLAKIREAEIQHKEFIENSKPIDKRDAKKKLIRRLDELAKRHGFSYNLVFIKNQRSRWGSCSSKNNINLNISLVTLPDELMDYVILHELVHTRVKNHSKKFWRELDKVVGDAKSIDKQLRKYGVVLF